MDKSDDFLDGFFVDDLINKEKIKKKKNGNRKGKSVERNLCKILSERFDKEFSRSIGSGNRWGQVKNMPQHAKDTLIGDLCSPGGFKFVIECKGGYAEIDLNNIFDGVKKLDNFLEQVQRDANFSGRQPLLIWKKDYKPWLACLDSNLLDLSNFPIYIIKNCYAIVLLDDLLNLPDSFFFN